MISDKQAIILKLLLDNGPLYGLELVQKSNGHLKRGSIYVLLDRMEDSGWIESAKKKTPKGEQGPARRTYRIIGAGERALAEKIEQRSAIAVAFGI